MNNQLRRCPKIFWLGCSVFPMPLSLTDTPPIQAIESANYTSTSTFHNRVQSSNHVGVKIMEVFRSGV